MTTTTTANPQPPAAPSILVRDWRWLTSHAIMLGIISVAAFGSVYFVENLVSKKEAAEDAKWQSILQTQTAQTQTVEAQLTADEKQWSVLQAALLKQNAQLAQTILVRNQQTQAQVKNDATLSAQDAATRLAAQTNAAPGEIVASGDNLTIDLPIARRFASSLDLLVGTQANLESAQAQLKNETELYTNAEADVMDNKKALATLNTELTDTQKADAATIKKLKIQSLKGKLKWFGIGYVAGFISGATAHLW